ncbi:MAG: J domain-containing protein [Bacteroidota bacterium]|nr:J domain-containing protein [Bacteroidota bacterium]MCA6442249.1 J domain-containing protein [Bacteroidota bacterium]
MINYYQILGLPNGSGIQEVKIAFRKLAKLYHPDKNPNGKEEFTRILKAYEILSDQRTKAQYDYNLSISANYSSRAVKNTTQKKKNYTFDEKEEQRRKYYNEHIKKYAKNFQQPTATEIKKSNYNEFKYILFASPLAVVLFIFIAFTVNNNKELPKQKLEKKVEQKVLRGIEMGDVPFAHYFGRLKFDSTNKHVLEIRNNSGYDIVLCFFKKNNFVRSAIVLKELSAEILELPKDSLSVKLCYGNKWDYDKIIFNNELYGNFTEDLGYAKLSNKLKVVKNTQLSFEKISTISLPITEKEFFEKIYD